MFRSGMIQKSWTVSVTLFRVPSKSSLIIRSLARDILGARAARTSARDLLTRARFAAKLLRDCLERLRWATDLPRIIALVV
jgi:hypothetical protein